MLLLLGKHFYSAAKSFLVSFAIKTLCTVANTSRTRTTFLRCGEIIIRVTHPRAARAMCTVIERITRLDGAATCSHVARNERLYDSYNALIYYAQIRDHALRSQLPPSDSKERGETGNIRHNSL